jgi:hypothetical protein
MSSECKVCLKKATHMVVLKNVIYSSCETHASGCSFPNCTLKGTGVYVETGRYVVLCDDHIKCEREPLEFEVSTPVVRPAAPTGSAAGSAAPPTPAIPTIIPKTYPRTVPYMIPRNAGIKNTPVCCGKVSKFLRRHTDLDLDSDDDSKIDSYIPCCAGCSDVCPNGGPNGGPKGLVCTRHPVGVHQGLFCPEHFPMKDFPQRDPLPSFNVEAFIRMVRRDPNLRGALIEF